MVFSFADKLRFLSKLFWEVIYTFQIAEQTLTSFNLPLVGRMSSRKHLNILPMSNPPQTLTIVIANKEFCWISLSPTYSRAAALY